jgi:eukaryotic-like serine/threonine-protein kinase
MPLASGTRLGHYEIVAALGMGGMGEVYRAHDKRLQRQVAIKVLRGDFSKDSERIQRFEREARVLASLNHPNIATIYGFEENAIVMELVDGKTLADRLAHGPLPVGEALQVTAQIAEALEVAHGKDIIHRDLKPSNVKVTLDGKVKLLDFGLARLLVHQSGADSSESGGQAATITATAPGVVLGTAAYMSPEQARGQIVDRRGDIWAFGCILYELLTAKRAFHGTNAAETLSAVFNS